jgi:transposase
MKAYSMDLRERIVAARRSGESVQGVAKCFGVCTKTVRVYEKRGATRGAGAARAHAANRQSPSLSDQEHEALRNLVQERSDWTLASLARSWQERQERTEPSESELPSSTLHDALSCTML